MPEPVEKHITPPTKVTRIPPSTCFPYNSWSRIPTFSTALQNFGYSIICVCAGLASAGLTMTVFLPLGFLKSLVNFAGWLLGKKTYDEPRVILITGANSGIGAALAATYAKPGNTLYLVARDMDRLNSVAATCSKDGATASVHAIDLAADDARDRMVKLVNEIAGRHGGIDMVAVVAGTVSINEPNSTGWDENFAEYIVQLNVLGAIKTVFPAWEKMKQRKKGKIVLLSSIAAWSAPTNFAMYSATKAFLYRFGLHLRQVSIPHNIDVITVCPGLIESGMTTAMKKAGSTAPMAVFASPHKMANRIKNAVEMNESVVSWPYSEGLVQYGARGLSPIAEELQMWAGLATKATTDILT